MKVAVIAPVAIAEAQVERVERHRGVRALVERSDCRRVGGEVTGRPAALRIVEFVLGELGPVGEAEVVSVVKWD